jgi:hypothetical protein
MKSIIFRENKFTNVLLFGAFALATILAPFMYAYTVEADTSPSTVTFELEKKFSGPVPISYRANQFTFTIVGVGSSFGPEVVNLTEFNRDSANGSIELPVGTYTLTENGPAGFDPAEWTVQWSGAGCIRETGLSTTIEVESRDLGLSNFGCRADNEWHHGILTIIKKVVDATTDVSNFSFVVTNKGNEIFNGPFDADDDVKVAVAVGEYEVVENSAPNFITTYSEGCSGTMEENETITCTITNTYDPAPVPGCTDDAANNYNPLATTDDGSCTYDPTPIPGCTDSAANNYDPSATTDDGSCTYDPGVIPGCTDPLANNYDATATTDDGSCTYDPTPVPGCTDAAANNYDPLATTDDGSCTYDPGVIPGCTDSLAINYNSLATTDDGSCDYGNDEEPTYKVFGYVWHDSNENDIWDGRGEEETEEDLDGWTVTITNGEKTYSTTTNEAGYYEFYVPAGTWTISETVVDEWQQTFPNDDGVYVVEVIDETADEGQEQTAFAPAGNFLTKVVDLFLPAVALAQTPTTYGEYNFGNVFTGGGDGGGGGGGGTRPPRCEFSIEGTGTDAELVWETRYGRELWITADGEEIFRTTDEDEVDAGNFPYTLLAETDFELTVKRFSHEETCQVSAGPSFGVGGAAPEPMVLGEQVSVVPVGAPNTGAGGAAPLSIPSPSPFVAMLMSKKRNVFSK